MSRFAILLLCAPLFAGTPESVLARLPLRFEANQGQFHPSVRFAAHAGGYNLLLRSSGPSLALGRRRVDIALLHSNPAPRIEGLDRLPVRIDSYRGGREQWRTGIASYGRVRYHSVYPGVDLIYYGNESQLEYDFVLAPGADPGAIRMRFRGAGRLRLTAAGDLLVESDGSAILQKRPLIYQEADAGRREIAGRYVLLGGNTVGLRLDPYDRSRALTIDPVLSYLTYMGGSAADRINAVKYFKGKIYIAGQTDNASMGYVNGAYNNNESGLTDIFLAIVDATPGAGYALTYLSYLGGANNDIPLALDVDANGVMYLTGTTTSTDFPVTANAFQNSGAGSAVAAYVVQLDPSQYGGNALLFSSYLGGLAGANSGNGIAVDQSGLIYVIGTTKSSDFPVTDTAFQAVQWGLSDAFITQIDPAAGQILYSTFLGGEDEDDGRNILVGPNGLVYFTASTLSTQFPMAAYQYSIVPFGAEDLIIGVMDLTQAGQNSLLYSTYFGGSANEEVRGMAFDAAGRLVITGYTLSTDFPVTADAVQPAPGGNGDAFLVIFDPSVLGPGGLRYSTYFGGSHTEVGYAVGSDSSGSIYLAGYTLSPNLAVTGNVPQAQWGGGTDLFLVKIKPGVPGPGGIQFSSYLGSTGVYVPTSLAMAPDGTLYMAGYGGIGLPSSGNAQQGGYAGGVSDGFLVVVGQ